MLKERPPYIGTQRRPYIFRNDRCGWGAKFRLHIRDRNDYFRIAPLSETTLKLWLAQWHRLGRDRPRLADGLIYNLFEVL